MKGVKNIRSHFLEEHERQITGNRFNWSGIDNLFY
jgi:hypothetical protein